MSASATAMAGSTWPAVPPPASTTDGPELTDDGESRADDATPAGEGLAPSPPAGSLIVPFTRNADLPMRELAVSDAGRRGAGQIHDALPAGGRRPQTGAPAGRRFGRPPPAAGRRGCAAPCGRAPWGPCRPPAGPPACDRGTPRYGWARTAGVAAAAAAGSPCHRDRPAARPPPLVRAGPRWS